MTSLNLSFCITCKNRFHQISQTLPKNIKDNFEYQEYIQFVLVDFGSNDGLKEWIKENFLSEIESGYLKYIYTNELPFWHASIAKNTAHLFADNDILVNLDCDNFTGAKGGLFIMKYFYNIGKELILHQFSGKYGDGTFGRIAVYRDYFRKITGYDENLYPMSMQDEDLIARLKSIGLRYINLSDPGYNSALVNTKQEGLVNTDTKLSYLEMQQMNRKISMDNLKEGKVIVNNNGWGIRKNLFDIYGNEIKLMSE